MLTTPDPCRGAFMGGSAPSDSPSEAESAEAASDSTAYNASLKPLKPKAPDQAGDMLPAEAILEQFDRAQQYVLKNRGEFTAEQQDKLQVTAFVASHCIAACGSTGRSFGCFQCRVLSWSVPAWVECMT